MTNIAMEKSTHVEVNGKPSISIRAMASSSQTVNVQARPGNFQNTANHGIMGCLPSGELTFCHGKSPFYSWEHPLFRLGHFPLLFVCSPEGTMINHVP